MAKRAGDLQRLRAASSVVAPVTVVSLDDARARRAHVVGAKAANLAAARANRLPALPGFVLAADAPAGDAFLAWQSLSQNGELAVAVRSSSTIEDTEQQSMAGHFTSVLDVRGWPAVLAAVARVRASANGAPMPVLVQPMCDAAIGGVLFGVDPTTGRERPVIEAVAGTPDALVSGELAGDPDLVSRRDRRRLRSLARDAARLFGGPQDIEWAIDRRGNVALLQSRPITTRAALAVGPRLGVGPVAETFPDALAPLEIDLWVEPLRAGIVEALRLVGTTSHRAIDASPVLVTIGGYVAADLDLVEGRGRTGVLARLDPRAPARRLVASWRVGRLRRAMPMLAGDLVARTDRELASIPPLDALDDAALLDLLARSRLTLRALHGHEVLAGMLSPDAGASGIARAVDAIADGRAAGRSDTEIVAAAPVVLALVPPRIGGAVALPEVTPPAIRAGALGHREALRLRARWVQELSARAALVIGRRRLGDDVDGLRLLTLDDLRAVVDGAPLPDELDARREVAPPLPAVFRLSADGDVIAAASTDAAGRGAGGGRSVGVVASVDDDAPGTVLVVRALDPRLAPRLPGRAGLVAETGSVLSHLAIVARELGVPTVVGVPGAVDAFPVGTRLVVDGRTGEVAPA